MKMYLLKLEIVTCTLLSTLRTFDAMTYCNAILGSYLAMVKNPLMHSGVGTQIRIQVRIRIVAEDNQTDTHT